MKTPEHIEKKEWGAYCTTCGCGCGERIVMEIDDTETGLSSLILRFEAKRCVWYRQGRWDRLKDRIGSSLRYLFTGKVEAFAELILSSPEHVRDIARIFYQLADKMEANQKKESRL